LPDSLPPAGIGEAVQAGSAWPAAVTRLVLVGETPVLIRFASARLAALFAGAFACAAAGLAPAWTLSVAAGGARPALAPPGAGGEMRLREDAAGYALWMGRHAPVLQAVDRLARTALYWVESTAQVPAWERSRPFLPILQAMLDDTPWIAVHGAAIAWGGRAALLAGPGRAGKTSLALAGLAAGWRFAGDDFVLLRTDAAPAVAPLYATARLRDDMVGHFPGLVAARREISEEDGERRHELDLPPALGEIGGAPLATALLLERRGAAAPALAPAGRAALLNALAATTLVATPGAATPRTARLLALMQRLAAPRRFDPGPDFAAALAALREAVG
jgi:hypothetical protein